MPLKGGSSQLYYNTQGLINYEGYKITDAHYGIQPPLFSGGLRHAGGSATKKTPAKKPAAKKPPAKKPPAKK